MMVTPPSYPAQAARLLHILEATDAAVLEQGIPADRFLADGFRQHRNLGSRTRRLISNTAFSFFRWRGWLVPAQRTLQSLPETDRSRALLFAHALDAETLDPLFVWWDTTLPPLATPLTGMRTLSLAEKATTLQRGQGRTDIQLACDPLVPDWFADQLAIPAPAEPEPWKQRWLESFQLRPPTWIRRIPAAAPPDDAWTPLQACGYPIQPLPQRPMTASCACAISRAHLQSPSCRNAYDIQDLASQCVGWIADPHPGERWWDACSGSGGKALHLASLMQGQGTLWATDIRRPVLRTLQQRWEATQPPSLTLQIAALDAAAGSPTEGDFDGVLVDAPCSGIGTWSRSPDARWRMPLRRVRQLAKTQTQLLTRTAQSVRPGGTLVYAVCTCTEAETIAQKRLFEERHPDFAPAAFAHPLNGDTCPGLAWIWPWLGPCGGMFIAKWTRNG